MSHGSSLGRSIGIAGSAASFRGLVVAVAVAVLIGPSAALAQQPGRGTYSPTPRSSGKKAAHFGMPTGRPPAQRQVGGGQIGARGASKPQIGSQAPARPQMGGGTDSSRVPSRVQLPQMPGQGNFIQPRK